MSLADAVLEILKDQLLPEVREMKQALVSVAFRLDTSEKETARRFDLVDRRFEQVDRRFEQMDRRFEQMDQRFEQMDQRFEQMDRRIEQQGAEHARRMDLLDKRIEHLEASSAVTGDRLAQLADAVGRLTLLGDYVRRVDELAAELRELKRRFTDEVLPRLPKTGS